jgi:putative DNA primase/helicase
MENINDKLNPDFNLDLIKSVSQELESFVEANSNPTKPSEIFASLLNKLEKIDFLLESGLSKESDLKLKHFLIITVDAVKSCAKKYNWNLCKHLNNVFLYDGTYWIKIDESELQRFLGEAAEKIGIDKYDSQFYSFRECLYKQFLAIGYLPKAPKLKSNVLINLNNGTFEINQGKQILRPFNHSDFLTYKLPFDFNINANAPLFYHYLNQVQPDIERQKILSEYIGYIFINNSTLKLEKTLLLYGNGANGKSVFFEIINALLGSENVSNYSLQNLTKNDGYARAMISNKLLNYSSEISGKLDAAIFKQLVSGEPVEARLPYQEPLIITDYAKLIFNCNDLPKDTEQTHAFFRRFIIISFDKTIPENEQDKELSKKIIESELSGVFNWVLEGLNRLVKEKKFTHSDSVANQLAEYRMQSDSVSMFLDDENYQKSTITIFEFKYIYQEYKIYCKENSYIALGKKNFSKRLRNLGFEIHKKQHGMIIYIEKNF